LKNKAVRLFVAVKFDDTIKSRLLALQDRIREQAVRGNFSRPENLHLTLVFIGETDPALLPVITGIVTNTPQTKDSAAIPTFTIVFNHTGCFRHSGKELWWIAANEGLDTLRELRQRIADGFDAEGIQYDKRPFKAHITLGREIRASSPIVLPDEKITVPVTRISLMKSEHIKGTLVYTEIAGQDLPK
jgi:2'-5' RNA ligase